MLDYRLHTFLKVCDTMNYRISAEELSMTQPGVTQHIQFLEKKYGCKLFIYDKKRLSKTDQGKLLEQYARSACYNDDLMKEKLSAEGTSHIRIGATKTIGEYIVASSIQQMIREYDGDVTFVVDNTEHLLHLIDHNNLDFALVEGFFNKEDYGHMLLKKDVFVGVCSKNHPFANKCITWEEAMLQTIILREKGSGTRAILEELLHSGNYTISGFKRRIYVSEFSMIKEIVKEQGGISFVYKSVADAHNEDVAVFYVQSDSIVREFNYVFLKNANPKEYINTFCKYYSPT